MFKHLSLCLIALLFTALAHAQSTSPDPKGGAEITGTIKEYTPGTVLVLIDLPDDAFDSPRRSRK